MSKFIFWKKYFLRL